jgi:hypothetical protein
MEDIEKILIENLKEALKSAQTYLLTGMGAALFLLLLTIQGRFNQPNEVNVGVPFVGLSAPTSAAAFIALGIYLLSGCIVLVLNNTCRRIEEKLRQSKTESLLDAVLTYPSLIRTSRLMGVGAALITFLLGAGALFGSWYPRAAGALSSLFAASLFSCPYLILTWSLGKKQKHSE